MRLQNKLHAYICDLVTFSHLAPLAYGAMLAVLNSAIDIALATSRPFPLITRGREESAPAERGWGREQHALAGYARDKGHNAIRVRVRTYVRARACTCAS